MKWKNWTLGITLTGIAIVGPLVAYASVNVIYPASQHTLAIDTTPPLTFDDGDDSLFAVRAGVLGAFSGTNNNASFTITINALSGANITVDSYAYLNESAGNPVNTWKIQHTGYTDSGISTAEITEFKVRAWTGASPPTSDSSPAVCAYLDMEATSTTESTGSCSSANVKFQLKIVLADAAAGGTGTVSLRPSSIAFN